MIEHAKWARKKFSMAINDNVYMNTPHTTNFVSSKSNDAVDKKANKDFVAYSREEKA